MTRTRAPRAAALVAAVAFAAACGGDATTDDPAGADATAGTTAPGEDDGGTASLDDGSPEAGSGAVPALHPSVDAYPEARVELLPADGEPVAIDVKLADDPDRRQHGLMEVEALPAGTGMLFTFESERDGGFWMKNTLVPLDIAYVGADGVVHTILAMEPCEADPCPVYAPDDDYVAALEVPQGWFADVGVEVGDRLRWERLGD
ncbi:DUF192 domain-containing protein [Egicoccus halophilus]|uniref:DUF192 domain-containing protein n=1 Tax=Egicoccus halophilus TaxID=1670830 RepID=A0A8J3ESM5_9ACTN|nr:DUF192 domain-containing protein [Egicoccus halophilus]GGI03321.1 hypothetical protein GCM10011354_03450 [Egicoccus halophilus]